jgi:hypothetical protein
MGKIKSWFYKVLGRLLLDYSNKKIIKLNEENPIFHKFLSNFKAKINIFTKNNEVTRSLTFDGNGGVSYEKNKVEEPDASLIFNSNKDFYKFIRSFGDVYEGMLENRFQLRGNLNVLFKYQFLTNFYNPKKDKIEIENLKLTNL